MSLRFSRLYSYLAFRRGTPTKLGVQLDDSVQWTPGPPTVRRDIALGLWNFDITEVPIPYTSLSLDAYFRYYTQQADLFVHDTGNHVDIRTHQHVVDICEILKDDLDRDQSQEKTWQRSLTMRTNKEANATDASLDLVIRLALMIEVGNIPNGFSGSTPLLWKQGKLSQLLSEHFNPKTIPIDEGLRLGKVFTARNIQRIAGIKVVWTDNLVDHLKLFDADDDDLGVMIFPHASFLVVLLEKYLTTPLHRGMSEHMNLVEQKATRYWTP